MGELYPTDDYDPTDPWGVKKRIRDLQGPPPAPALTPSQEGRIADAENVFTPRDYASAQASPTRTSQPDDPSGRVSINDAEAGFTPHDYVEGLKPEDPLAGIYKKRDIQVPAPGVFENMHGTVSGIIGGIQRSKREAALHEQAMEEKKYQDSIEEARLRQAHSDRLLQQGNLQAYRDQLAQDRQDRLEAQAPKSRKTVVDGKEVWQTWNRQTQDWETQPEAPVGNKPSVADEEFARWKTENPEGTWTQYKKWAASLGPDARAADRQPPQDHYTAVPQFGPDGKPAPPKLLNTRIGKYVDSPEGVGPTRGAGKEPTDKTAEDVNQFEAKLRLQAPPRNQKEEALLQERVRNYEQSVTSRKPPKPVSMGDVRANERGMSAAPQPTRAAPQAQAPTPAQDPSKLSEFLVNPKTGHKIGRGLDGHWYDAQTGALVK